MIPGKIAEELFSRSVESLLNDEETEINKVIPNMKYDGMREYDIVAVNESEAYVFEIKNKLRADDINTFCDKQLSDFKKIFHAAYKKPRINKTYKVYGGVGALVVRKQFENQAKKRGLYVLAQGKDGNALFTCFSPQTCVLSKNAPPTG